MTILVHMPGDGVWRAHLVVVALTGSAPWVHDRVVVAHHSPSMQHVIDICRTVDDLEDLPLHYHHGVEEATAIGGACSQEDESETETGRCVHKAGPLPPLPRPTSQAICQQVCVDSVLEALPAAQTIKEENRYQ